MGGVWQKKLMLTGFSVRARMFANCSRNNSGVSIAQGSEPRPPASDTSTTKSASIASAIGAKMIGCSILSSFIRRLSGHTKRILSAVALPLLTLPTGGNYSHANRERLTSASRRTRSDCRIGPPTVSMSKPRLRCHLCRAMRHASIHRRRRVWNKFRHPTVPEPLR